MLGLGLSINKNNKISLDSGQVPTSPTNLVAEVISQSQINLTWDDNASDELVYKIEISENNVDWTEIEDSLPANSESYNAIGLDSNTLYYFRVRCANSTGDSDYSNTVSATTLSFPSDITNLVAWWSADSGVTTSGGLITQILDRSGNGFTITSDSGERPALITNELNSLPVMRFSGLDNILRSASNIGITGSSQRTMIVVTKSTFSTTQFVCGFGTSGTGQSFAGTLNPGAETSIAFTGVRRGVTNGLNTWHILSFIFPNGSTSSNDGIIFRNGVSLSLTNTSGTAQTVNTGAAPFAIGAALPTSTSSFFNGDVAEVILYSKALSNGERESVEQYLANKYGIALS